MTNEDEDTGRESTYARESMVTGPYGATGLSAKRLGEANEGAASSRHPALYALGFLAVAAVAIVVLVLILR
jgi:hypothetical protein